uniref:probable aspartic proteinase GIP2 n=1 Tax=Erigeron canadensis TaxID=72917 RepID=UPI001CB8F614|nr:probable aspartic proteinase GIP2 [Erigeron canadensis]
MASAFSIPLVFLCSFLFIVSSCIAKTTPRPILQVTKDAKTLQYVTQVYQRTPLVPIKLSLDLGGEFMWVNCERGYASSSYKNPTCGSPPCQLLNTTSCITGCLGSPSVDCANNTCGSTASNPFGSISTGGPIVGDVFAIQSTNGKSILPLIKLPSFYFVCGSNVLDVGLANGVTGLAGLGRTGMSLPAQLSSYLKYDRKFALCLSSSNGAVFFGDGPYMLGPNVDASTSLQYTPLIVNTITGGGFFGDASPEYFIGVKSIKINEKRVTGFNESLFSFNAEGEGGTIISTTRPYTVLETTIYRAVISAFVKAMPKNVERVANVAPFGACFSSKNIISTRLGPAVPSIELVLESKNVWRIYGANSMVQVNKDVLCLGFVEARTDFSPTIKVVIGGYQIENNLLQFDLVKSRLGFSSSLLGRSTTCANFNFK